MSANRKTFNFMDTMFCLPKEEGGDGDNDSKMSGVAQGGHCFVRVNNTLLKILGKSVSISGAVQRVDGVEVTENDSRAVKKWPLNSKGEVLGESLVISQSSAHAKVTQKLVEAKNGSDAKKQSAAESAVGMDITSGTHQFNNQHFNFTAPKGKSMVGVNVSGPGTVANFTGGSITVIDEGLQDLIAKDQKGNKPSSGDSDKKERVRAAWMNKFS